MRVSSYQLRQGKKPLLFGRGEWRELQKLLREQEEIFDVLYGFYPGGTAVLAVTSERLLLIDKQTYFLKIEEIRYGMISRVMFSKNVLQASLGIRNALSSQTFIFKTMNNARLKATYYFIAAKAEGEAQHIAQALDAVPAFSPRRRVPKFYTALHGLRTEKIR